MNKRQETMNNDQKIIVRFPPSPTGPLHFGNVRTAIFNYLFAKQSGGQFFIRVEDTDKARSDKKYELEMLDHMQWLGFSYDNPEIWHQSERSEVYKKYLDQLIKENKAYLSEEIKGSSKKVVRFRNPNKKVVFEDLVRGQVEFDTTELGDFIIARNINDPIYHLTVVVDDFESGITHVIRGEDHISNTPRQILIQEAIGAQRPIYAHIPLILGLDRSKLSKRHGAIAVSEYRNKGYLPGAIINYLALLGWNPGTEKEIFTMEELIKEFTLEKIQKGGAIFDEKKLQWINKEHIKLLPLEKQRELFLESIKDEPYMVGEPVLDVEQIAWKKSTKEEALIYLEKVKEIVSKVPFDMSKTVFDIMEYAEGAGKGNVLWPLRYALTGAIASPDPITLLQILGKEKSLKRLENAIIALREEI